MAEQILVSRSSFDWCYENLLIYVVGGRPIWRIAAHAVLDAASLVHANIINEHLRREHEMLEIWILEAICHG